MNKYELVQFDVEQDAYGDVVFRVEWEFVVCKPLPLLSLISEEINFNDPIVPQTTFENGHFQIVIVRKMFYQIYHKEYDVYRSKAVSLMMMHINHSLNDKFKSDEGRKYFLKEMEEQLKKNLMYRLVCLPNPIDWESMFKDNNEDLGYTTSVLQGSETSRQLAALAKMLPGVNEQVTCPACVAHAQHREDLFAVIIHLNDSIGWTRERIADWIESLDIDTTFKDVIERPKVNRADITTLPSPYQEYILQQMKPSITSSIITGNLS